MEEKFGIIVFPTVKLNNLYQPIVDVLDQTPQRAANRLSQTNRLLTDWVSLAACIPTAGSLPPPFFASSCQCCHRSQAQADQSLCCEEVLPLPVLGPQMCSSGDGCRWIRNNHSDTRVHKITAWLSPFPRLTCTGASSVNLGRAVSVLVEQCLERHVVCWPPPTDSLLLLQTPYQCMLPESADCCFWPQREVPEATAAPDPQNIILPWAPMLGMSSLWTLLGIPPLLVCPPLLRQTLSRLSASTSAKMLPLRAVSWSIKQRKLQ